MDLAYLFECHFKDETVILQTQDDVSAIDPSRNAFYDVLQRLPEVAFFGIFNSEHTYTVVLEDGHFEIDGVAFHSSPPKFYPSPDLVYRLIFFRRHLQTTSMAEGQSHTVAYHLGWQTNLEDGTNVQQTISIF